MKLMSLFDGSGGFPLAASLCGIKPIYAAEVEPYPVAVTSFRFPKMKHLGDIRNIKGNEIEPVDIITFGSPCQDMSIAGKRAGLKHADMGDDETTRSGLFLEAIRIIKEMREATNGVYPRYAIWENVPGAFSSNRGEDFRTVLEEFIRIKEKDVVMPSVPAVGWAYADCISGDGWSLAYRTFDAQYWGVPQRRRRIYLVADFRGGSAKEILFECKGLRGDTTESRTPMQGTAKAVENGTGADDCEGNAPYALKIRSDCEGGDNLQVVVYDTRGNGDGETVPTITGDHNNRVTDYTCLAITRCCDIGEARLRTPSEYIKKSPTIAARCGTGGNNVLGVAYCIGSGQVNQAKLSEKVGALNCMHDQQCVAYKETQNSDKNSLQNKHKLNVVKEGYIVRRLTPTECARLQGFPSWWGIVNPVENLTDEDYTFWLGVRNTYAEINGKATKEYTKQQMLSWYNKLHSDSAEYKMWGNGIALPNALYVMQGIAAVER